MTATTADKVIGSGPNSVSYSASEKDPSGPIGTLGWSGQTLIINGTLIVNDPTWFLNCTVKMGPGARIIVQSNQLLLAWFSRFFACDFMWEGIKFDPNSNGSFGYNHIEDANTAIHSTQDVPLVMINNRFNRNYTGIFSGHIPDIPPYAGTTLNLLYFFDNHFTVTSPLNAPYPGQTPKNYTVGVHLSKSTATLRGLQTAPNHFSRLGYGIYSLAVKSSVVDVEHAIFTDQEACGIYCLDGQLKVSNCSFKDNYVYGIIAEGRNKLSVKNCHFDAEDAQFFGIFSDGISCDVRSCQFNQAANHLAAVYRIHRGNTEISHNFIQIASMSDGIVVEPHPTSGSTGGGCNVTYDTIVIKDRPFSDPENIGIHVTGGSYDGFNISHNRIDIRTDCGPFCNVRGIVFDQCSGIDNTVSSNEVFNTDVQVTGKSASQAIFIRNVQNGLYCLNSTTDTYEGITFFGTNVPARIEQNLFNRHNYSLVIDGDPLFAPAAVGTQFRGGNKWVPDGYKMLAAACTGVSGFSPFFIHSPLFLYFLPPPFISPPSNWFFESFGPLTPVCGRKPEEPEAFETAIADGSYYDANATALLRWELDRMLYYKMLRTPDYGANNPVFAAFFAAKANTSAGKFAKVERDLYLVSGFSAAMLDALEDLNTQCDALLAQLEQLEGSLQPPTIPQGVSSQAAMAKESLLEELKELGEQRAIILAQADSIKAIQLASIRAYNASIAVTEVFEQNQKALNELAIKMALREPLTNSDLDLIVSIADQPDTVAGTTRWRAISWLPCRQQDEVVQREHFFWQRQMESQVVEAAYRIAPNPTSGVLIISFPEPFIGQISLLDISGRVYRAQRIRANNADIVRLSVQDLSTGLYYLQIQKEGQATETHKIIITH